MKDITILVEYIDNMLLPQLQIESVGTFDPIVVKKPKRMERLYG